MADYEDRKHLFEIAKKRLDLGTTTKSEVLQMELSLLNAKMSVNSTSLTLRTQLFSLFSYLRIVDYGDIELLPPYYMPEIEMNAEQVLDKAWTGSSHSIEQQLNLLAAGVGRGEGQQGLAGGVSRKARTEPVGE